MKYVSNISEQLTVSIELQPLFPTANRLIIRSSHCVRLLSLKNMPALTGHLQNSNAAKHSSATQHLQKYRKAFHIHRKL